MPKFTVSKSAIIEKPIDEVFAFLSNMSNWQIWSPWLITDENAKATHSPILGCPDHVEKTGGELATEHAGGRLFARHRKRPGAILFLAGIGQQYGPRHWCVLRCKYQRVGRLLLGAEVNVLQAAVRSTGFRLPCFGQNPG